jgi:hypothetical protein
MVSLPPQTFPCTTGTIHLAYRELGRSVADPDLPFLALGLFWGSLPSRTIDCVTVDGQSVHSPSFIMIHC